MKIKKDHIIFGPINYEEKYKKERDRLSNLLSEKETTLYIEEKHLLDKKIEVEIHENTLKYIDTFVEKRFFYTIWDITRLLDLKQQYVQRKLVGDLESLYITIRCKTQIKEDIKRLNKQLKSAKTKEGLEDIIRNHHKLYIIKENVDLAKKLWFSEESFINLITSLLYREEKDGKLRSLNDLDVKTILNNQLLSPGKLKEKYFLQHDTQLYRMLEGKDYIKYVIPLEGRKSLARYVIF